MKLDVHHWWKSQYPNALPIGYMLRDKYKDYWTRIHTLPEGKRYATTAEEIAVLRYRQNTAISAVLGAEAECAIVNVAFGMISPKLQALNLQAHAAWTKAVNAVLKTEDEESAEATCWVSNAVWTPGCFDAALEAVAEDETGPLLFAAWSSANVCALYDGGVDTFIPDPPSRRSFRARFADWR